jgi:hypothetical protein
METLRILLLALRGTRTNRLTTLLLVLLTGAPLASAQQMFNATSGSMIDPSDLGASYAVAGPGFSTSGVIDYSGFPLNPIDSPFTTGKLGELIFEGDTANPNLDKFSLAVHGVPWSYPMGTATDGEAIASFQTNSANLLLSGPGTYSSTFSFVGSLVGAPLSVVSANPTWGCAQIECTSISMEGGGTVTFDVVAAPGIPGSFEISKATFTFNAPEPSTASLLLIALAGLAVLGRGGKHGRAALTAACPNRSTSGR